MEDLLKSFRCGRVFDVQKEPRRKLQSIAVIPFGGPPTIPGEYTETTERISATRANVEAIASAVGDRFIPADLNTHALHRSLVFACYEYHRINEDRKRSVEVRRQVHIQRTRKHLDALLQLLSRGEGEWLRATLLRKFPEEIKGPGAEMREAALRQLGWLPDPNVPTLRILFAGLAHLKKELKELKAPKHYSYEHSPFEWFVGISLANIFEEHFHRKASRSRPSRGDADGPYIRFVMAMLKELNIKDGNSSYRRESIVRAISLCRTGKTRKKPKEIS